MQHACLPEYQKDNSLNQIHKRNLDSTLLWGRENSSQIQTYNLKKIHQKLRKSISSTSSYIPHFGSSHQMWVGVQEQYYRCSNHPQQFGMDLG